MRTTTSAPVTTTEGAALSRVLCGVDASRADREAVRQAATIAGPDGQLDLVCVAYAVGVGATAQASISISRADAALDAALRFARDLGVPASARLVRDPDDWSGLAAAAEDHDLLVLGSSHAGSRAGGIMFGSTTTRALHEAALPVLVAREARTEFPSRILLATDGLAPSNHAAALAAAIARTHGSTITVLTVGPAKDRARRHALAVQAADLFRASGVEPTVLEYDGPPRDAVVEAVARHEPALVVLGSGDKHGIRAIGSVSEHVAHHAACSVLVARGPTTDEPAG
jgi:nucleotide-binding universal stress UspA family protein